MLLVKEYYLRIISYICFVIRIVTIYFFKQNHLETLRCALKDYIMDQNRSVIEQAITSLKEDLDFDSNAINELNAATYMFQEAVNVVLRMHSIKPHWMFALDNLVRNAVQAAITVLTPGEL